MKVDKHFTLVELLAVVVIITILATILIGGVTYAMKKADASKTQSQLEKLELALEAFKVEKGYYPPCASANDVKFNIADDGKEILFLGTKTFSMLSKSGKPFIEFQFKRTDDGDPYTDAWDNAFQYKCPGTHNPQKYDLWSMGEDGKSDTTADKEDDITNW